MDKGELLEMYKALIPIAKIDFDREVEIGYFTCEDKKKVTLLNCKSN